MKTHIHTKRVARKARVRGKIVSSATKPRVSVHRSNAHMSVQAIDDTAGVTLAAVTDLGKNKISGTKVERAQQIATALATQLKKKKITQVIFDRGYYKYHGRVKAVADALREQGLKV